MRPKGSLSNAQVAFLPTVEYGVRTEWAVVLTFQSPTGDSSDFLQRTLPCLTENQAQQIAENWLKVMHLMKPDEVAV